MKIAIGSDHAGYQLKEQLIRELSRQGFELIDMGCVTDTVKSDYTQAAADVIKLVLTKQASKGILICGTGIGMSIFANRHKGIRAALVSDTYTAVKSKEHNHSNVLCIGARVLGSDNAMFITTQWLDTKELSEYAEAASKVELTVREGDF